MKTISNKLVDLISLEGKAVVITGAASGIGRATAIRIAQANATIVLADLDMDGLAETVEDLETDGKIHLYQLDISDPDKITEVIAEIHKEVGAIHAWLNIAGIFPGASTLEMSAEEWNVMININLRGAFFCAQQAAKYMVDDNVEGVIVNTISTTTQRPAPGLIHYAASKGGVEAMTKALAREWGTKGIRVLNVCPTMTKTKGMEDQEEGLAQAFGDNPFESYGKELPLKGKIAEPDFIARAFLFAVSDLAVLFTGSTLYPDAGELLL